MPDDLRAADLDEMPTTSWPLMPAPLAMSARMGGRKKWKLCPQVKTALPFRDGARWAAFRPAHAGKDGGERERGQQEAGSAVCEHEDDSLVLVAARPGARRDRTVAFTCRGRWLTTYLETPNAAPVRCNAWIIIMASLGWAEACPKG